MTASQLPSREKDDGGKGEDMADDILVAFRHGNDKGRPPCFSIFQDFAFATTMLQALLQ